MVNYAGKTSMEVGCRVETEDMATGTRRYVCKSYLTFVAVDAHGKPRTIPALELVDDDARRRHEDARLRRTDRLRAAGRTGAS